MIDEFMQVAIEEAKKGKAENGIPIGSFLVKNRKVIGRGYNRRVQDNDPIAHAEIVCLRSAGRIGTYGDTVLYSTLMPCYLCAGAIVQFGIKNVVVSESETFQGAKEFMELHNVKVIDLDLFECKQLMCKFIRENPSLCNEDIGK